jgi:hypothetical protein
LPIDFPHRRHAGGEGPLSRFPSNRLAPKVPAARPLDGMVDIRDLKTVFFELCHPVAFGRIACENRELVRKSYSPLSSSVTVQGPTRSREELGTGGHRASATACARRRRTRAKCGRGEIGRRSRLQLECPRGNPWSRTAQSRGKLMARPKPIPSQALRGRCRD